MSKSIILFLIFLLNSFCLKAQTFDTLFNKSYPQIFILGITEFKNLVQVHPNFKMKTFEKKKEELTVVMEIENVQSFLKTKKRDFRYIALEPNCYIIGSFVEKFVHNYIIPIASEEYLPILNKTYPNLFIADIGSIYSGKKEYYKGYKIENIMHHKFLVVLVHVPLYNHFRSAISPPRYRFKGDKAEQGMYLKVLIPLAESQ